MQVSCATHKERAVRDVDAALAQQGADLGSVGHASKQSRVGTARAPTTGTRIGGKVGLFTDEESWPRMTTREAKPRVRPCFPAARRRAPLSLRSKTFVKSGGGGSGRRPCACASWVRTSGSRLRVTRLRSRAADFGKKTLSSSGSVASQPTKAVMIEPRISVREAR